MTKEAMDEPFAVYHSHSARLLLSNQIESVVSVGGNRLVFSMGERTGKHLDGGVEKVVTNQLAVIRDVTAASKIEGFIGCFGGGKPVKPTASTGFVERAMGIEPTSAS